MFPDIPIEGEGQKSMMNKRRMFALGVTLAALIAVLGTVVFVTRGTVKAASNGVGTLGNLTFVNDTTIGPVTQNANQTTKNDQVRPETDRSPQVAVANSSQHLPPPPTTNPNPAGRAVVTTNFGATGFNGLSHYDQRNAGTGIYTNTQFSLEPPDQGLCVNGGFVVEAVNNALAVYNTHGTTLGGPTALSQFFNFTPEIDRVTGVTGQFISDPKCLYDAGVNRWFLTELMEDTGTTGSGRTYTLIAVSQTSDPTGTWAVFKFDTTDDGLNGTPNHAGCPCFGDQPLIGADYNGFYVSTNEFGATTFNGAQIYAISKQKLAQAAENNSSIPPVVHIDASSYLNPFGGISYSIQPAVRPASDQDNGDDRNNGGIEYFLSALQFGAPPYTVLDNRIATWALANTGSLRNSHPNLSLSVQVIGSETYGQPNPAAQKAGPIPFGSALGDSEEFINTNDDRMNQVVFTQGVLWAGLNTLIGDGTRTGIAYFGVHPSWSHGALKATMAHQGYVAVKGDSVMYPSVGVNAQGKGIIAFTLVGQDYFPSAAYTYLGGDNHNGKIHVIGAGQLPDDGFSGYPQYSGGNVGRWGDYSAAVVMPDGSVWAANEYIPNAPRTLFANWGTFVYHITTAPED